MSVIDSEGNEEELVMSQYVMENIEGHVKSMQVCVYIRLASMHLNGWLHIDRRATVINHSNYG